MALILVLFFHAMTVTGIVLQIRSVLIPSSVCLLINSRVSITNFVVNLSCLIFQGSVIHVYNNINKIRVWLLGKLQWRFKVTKSLGSREIL